MPATPQSPVVTGGKPVLALLTFSAMSAGTFTLVAIGILATFIIDDLEITRAQLGLVIGADSVLAALLSPVAGRIADTLGGKRSLIAVFLLAAVAYLAYGVAPIYALLFLGAAIGGAADAACNPATNRLIAESLVAGERGVVTGIKQSGVQAGAFFAGLTLPSLAIAFGWRTTYFLVAALPLVGAFVASRIVHSPPSRRRAVPRQDPESPALSRAVHWLAAFGFVFGFAGSVSFLVPLYVEEGMGLDARVGGFVAAVIGLAAVAGRVGWAHYAELRGAFVGTLWSMTPVAVLGGLAFLGSGTFPALAWLGAALLGLSTSSWNSVGMLAVMSEAGTAATGRASGVVLLGFLGGLGIGPPIYGALVDAAGSYAPMWWTSVGASAAASLLVAIWRNRAPFATEPSGGGGRGP